MAGKLHARPNLDHLKKQAKALQAERGPGYRLADAQLAVARSAGFGSWSQLVRHVTQLRALEGEWTFVGLETDGVAVPTAMTAESRLLIDGDRFRMTSPEADYEGVMTVDVESTPWRLDIAFVAGPEAGHVAEGIFEQKGDTLTICLGLVGSSRPKNFVTTKGSGHALERLRRASSVRPRGVTGGRKPEAPPLSTPVAPSAVDLASFDGPLSPLVTQMQGEWKPTALVRDGEAMNEPWLAFGSRIGSGSEVKVVFGGQTMVHAKVKVDESVVPIAIDYLGLSGASKGRVTLGVIEWAGDELRVNMAAPGQPRPEDFTSAKGSGRTLSQWRRT